MNVCLRSHNSNGYHSPVTCTHKSVPSTRIAKYHHQHLPKSLPPAHSSFDTHIFKIQNHSRLNQFARDFFNAKFRTRKLPSSLPIANKGISKKNTHYLNRNEDVIPRKKIKRTKSSFSANRTISRQSESEHLHANSLQQNGLSNVMLNDLHDRIQDHAYRRMQIFYYLCTVYYEEGCKITLGHTHHQHGTSKCENCSAAHSSILPNVTDDFLEKFKAGILKNGLDSKSEAKMLALGVSKDKIAFLKVSTLNEFWLDFCFDHLHKKNLKNLLSEECQFYDIMNSTVELPDEVNEYDTRIEGVMRDKALEILNQVSQGKVLPYDATKLFEQEMQVFFTLSDLEAAYKINMLESLYQYEIRLKKLETELNSGNIKNYKEWLRDYVYNIMLTRKLIDDIGNTTQYTIKVKVKNHLQEHNSIIDMIFQACLKERNHLETIADGKDLHSYAQALNKKIAFANGIAPDLKSMLETSLTEQSFDKRKAILTGIWNMCDPIEIFLKDSEAVKRMLGKLQASISELPSWEPSKVDDHVIHLTESRLICSLQASASLTPPFEVLFGKDHGALTRNYVEEKMFLQKLEIMKRK